VLETELADVLLVRGMMKAHRSNSMKVCPAVNAIARWQKSIRPDPNARQLNAWRSRK
jgi:hypothetical protein